MPERTSSDRVLKYEPTRLIRMNSPEEALSKAVELARAFFPSVIIPGDAVSEATQIEKGKEYLRKGQPMALGPINLYVSGSEIHVTVDGRALEDQDLKRTMNETIDQLTK